MNYVISDIHGCYEQYMKLLDKIHFSERDTLYLLGDLVDRGPEPMEVVKDVMRRKNVVTTGHCGSWSGSISARHRTHMEPSSIPRIC